mgnify:CR=1 FL=1
MSLRILHILDHSLPLHSGYVFRTLAILREQRRLGWETFQLTSPKQGPATAPVEDVDGWRFYRTDGDVATLDMSQFKLQTAEGATFDLDSATGGFQKTLPVVSVLTRDGVQFLDEDELRPAAEAALKNK